MQLLQVTRREYRGQRSVDAFSNYVREQMKSKIIEFHSLSDLNVEVSFVNIIFKQNSGFSVWLALATDGHFSSMWAVLEISGRPVVRDD